MYIYVKSVLRERDSNSQYKEVDIRNLRLDQILSKYLDGYIELEHTQVASPFFVPLNDLRSFPLPYGNNNFQTWLGQISTTALPTYDSRPIYTVSKVIYSDAALAGFNMKRVVPITNVSGPQYTMGQMRDIICTKDGYNGDDMVGKFLITVNGLCHNSGYVREGFVVFDGARTLDVSKTTGVGVVSFEKIGTIKTLHLGEGRLIGERLRSEMFIKTGESLVGKSVMLSIGGYLHACDGSYQVIDDENGIIRIDTPKLDISRRMMRCMTRMDLSEIGLSQFELIDNAVIIPETLDNNVLRKYMLLPQSFVIIVDTPHLYAHHIPLKQLPIAGYSEYPTDPTLPLVDDYGHLLEYWKGGGKAGWALISNPREFLSNELYNTGSTETNTVLSDPAVAGGYDYHHYHLLEIGTQKMTFE